MNAREFYLKQEAKKGFKDWTRGGLEFLLHRDKLQKECKKALHRLEQKAA